MAILSTLEGYGKQYGRKPSILEGLFGACGSVFNSCTMAGAALLGAVAEKKIFGSKNNFWIPDLDYTLGFNAIKDEFEREYVAKSKDASIPVALSWANYGVEDLKYKVPLYTWLLPVQGFLNDLWKTLTQYPELDLQGAAAKAYFQFLAGNPKPQNYRLQTMYDSKINALNEFLQGMGWYTGIMKVRAEEARERSGAAAQASASEQAKAYKEAMERRAAEEAEVKQVYEAAQEETQANIKAATTTTSGPGILPAILAAAAAFLFTRG